MMSLPVLLNSVTQLRLQSEYAKEHKNPLFYKRIGWFLNNRFELQMCSANAGWSVGLRKKAFVMCSSIFILGENTK